MERTKKISSAFRLFENRRKYPRIRVNNLPVKVTGAGGKILKATFHDISPDGAQVRYLISEGMNLFVDEKARAEEIKSVRCTIEFVLAYRGENISVKLHARPVYLRTVSQRVISTGLLFVDNDLAELKKVSDFLFYRLELSYSNIENRGESDVIAKPPGETVNTLPAPQAEIPQAAGAVLPEAKAAASGQPKIDMEFLHTEIRRLASGQKILLENIRRLDDRMHKIEQTLFKPPEQPK